jgi:leucyl aminopeptidase
MSLKYLSLLFAFISIFSSVNCGEFDYLRLISFNETDARWMSPYDVEALIAKKVNFIDITDHLFAVKSAVVADPLPVQPIHKIYVNELLAELSIAELRASIERLTTFTTRYYRTDTGRQAAEWIFETLTKIAAASERTDITVEFFNHTGWTQPSVVATIPGIGPNKDQVVLVGGHEDSVGTTTTGRAPGADDDATGSATVIELFRVLVDVNHRPDRTLKFFTYSGEEAGLLGSQAIANDYASRQVNVYAALQLDMTGYGGDEGDIGIVLDNVDIELTNFVKILIDAYSLISYVDTKCGYGCSDHASWTNAGYRSAFPFETDFTRYNPYIHSANDVITHLSLPRILEFAKVGLGFLVELGGVAIEP